MLLVPFDVFCYLLPQAVDPSGFRFLRYMILPLIALGLVALGVAVARHRGRGKNRS